MPARNRVVRQSGMSETWSGNLDIAGYLSAIDRQDDKRNERRIESKKILQRFSLDTSHGAMP